MLRSPASRARAIEHRQEDQRRPKPVVRACRGRREGVLRRTRCPPAHRKETRHTGQGHPREALRWAECPQPVLRSCLLAFRPSVARSEQCVDPASRSGRRGINVTGATRSIWRAYRRPGAVRNPPCSDPRYRHRPRKPRPTPCPKSSITQPRDPTERRSARRAVPPDPLSFGRVHLVGGQTLRSSA